MKISDGDYLNYLEYSDKIMDELEHHGIKGMKWGVRRTPEQLGHRKEKRAKNKAEKKAKKDAKRREKILRDPKKLSKHLYEFSDAEITNSLKHFDWQKHMNDLSPSKLKQGSKIVENTVKTAGSLIAAYNIGASVYNTISGTEKPLPAFFAIPKKR